MKTVLVFLLPVALFLSFYLKHETKINNTQTVNSVIGDISFIEKFGYKPNASTDENLRIKTHLEYVEKALRQKSINHLTSTLKQQRAYLLDLLHSYWMRETFPRNYDYKEVRKPCFIDKDNRICAVGYLIERSAGRQIAEEINRRHKYERILAMNDQMVDNWIKSSGLSKEECAMIQPQYGLGLGGTFIPAATYSNSNNITPAYGMSSSILGGANLSLNTLNTIHILKGSNSKSIAVVGVISGAAQTILGSFSFPKTSSNLNGNTTNESRKTLSMINIGLGTTTMILSAWNLITNKKSIRNECKKTTWSLNSYETPNNSMAVSLTLNRKL